MADQDPENIPEQPEDAAPEAAGGSDAPAPDDIAEAIDRSQRAAESLDADTQSDAPPEDVSEAADGALKTAEAAVAAAKGRQGETSNGAPAATKNANGSPEAVALPDFNGAQAAANGSARDIDLLADVNLNVTIELGRTRMLVEDVLRLGEGSVVELDKLAGDPVDVFVNGRHVARGEVLVVNDNFCVRVSEILSRNPGSDD